jgi:sugar phosphate permease
MAVTEIPPAVRPTQVRWGIFSLAFGTSALLYLHRYVFAFIKPAVAKQWDLSATELGELDSAFSLCYTVFQFPLAIVADLLGVHVVLTGLMLTWCTGLGMLAGAPSVKWIWYALAALGTGQSAVYACLSRIARTWFPPATRTTLQGLVGILAGRLGALSSSLVFTSLLLGVWGLDWRTAVWILVAIGAVHTLLFAVFFRNSPRQHPGVNDVEYRLIEGPTAADSGSSPLRRIGLKETLGSATPRSLINLGWLGLQTILSTFADNIYSSWIPLFLAKEHQLDFKQMGLFAALPLLGGACAGLLGGLLNDYFIALTGKPRWVRTTVASVGKGLAAVLMFAALLFYDRPYVFCTFLFFVKLFGDWSLVTAWGVVTDIGGRATASVFAFNNSIAGISLIAAPIVYGYLADHWGWRAVFTTVGITYVLCALTWLAIDCTIPIVREANSNNE